ncbi:helix-turn-helix domain-containing protein [Achromobacter seleniivolatilans]|uniref:Helix-turn-helix domain-containing protein n=1 Tax=Achromobacter seleniivolatilans TaxID=3047478 RepID=A0ABY9M3R4_9BURK|nr:helix-turn-helix domain-containing protein [Achromobacter sp. R39]WMD21653.1 helix-turn-helix domain-containing protein [Achromobacter sp. R39]
MTLSDTPDPDCPMVAFVNLISGKWAIPILYRLIVIGEPVRFSALQRAVAPITQKELTRQLRMFEERGLIRREVYAEVPPRVEYEITALGRTLQPTLDTLAGWMRQHATQLREGGAAIKQTNALPGGR